MTDYTTATVISCVDPDATNIDPGAVAIDHARAMFQQVSDHRDYYHSAKVSGERDAPVVPMEGDEGQQRLEAQLEKTAKRRKENILKILGALTNNETAENASKSLDILEAARRLGQWSHPDCSFLYDGTSYSKGNPVISQEQVDEIVDHVDGDVYLVDIRLTW